MRNYERVQQYARERAIKDANKRIDEIVLDLLTDIEMEQDVINDQLVKLWDAAAGKLISEFAGHT